LPQIPDRYLEVTHVLQISESIPSRDREAWWNQWTAMLLDGRSEPTATGYLAVAELARAIEARAEPHRAWLDAPQDIPMPTGVPRENQWDDVKPWSELDHEDTLGPGYSLNRHLYRSRCVKTDADASCVMDLVDVGFDWDQARERVMESRTRMADRAVGRALLIRGLLNVFEDFGVFGEWKSIRERYPVPVGRIQVGDLPPLPEAEADVIEMNPGRRASIACFVPEAGTIDHLVPVLGDGVPDSLRELFPTVVPAPPGVKPNHHTLALIAGRAVATARENSALPEFKSSLEFELWASDLAGVSRSTLVKAFRGTGIYAVVQKRGDKGAGLPGRLERAEDYWRRHGARSAD